MKSYKYIARDKSGQRLEGVKQAISSSDVISWLRDQRLTPVSISEAPTNKVETRRKKTSRKKIKSADLSALFWQLTTMLEGGISITVALDTIVEDIENLKLQEILQHIHKRMEKGETFSSSVAEFPKVFNRLSCALILAGETGGNLPETLRRLAEYYDNRDKLAKKVKGAMAYPAFVFTFIILIVVFIMAFIVPRFKLIFRQFGGQLPGFTRAFMNFYDVLRFNIVYIAGFVILLLIAGTLFYTRTKKGHYFISKISLSIPLIGKIFTYAFIATFCRTMSTLLAMGVSVLEVFDILAGMTSNDIIKSAITQTKEHIMEGSNVSLSMAMTGFFPNLVVKMTQVGEESGSLPKVLERTSSYFERKVDATITTVMSLLEPIMIVTVGSIVLVVVLALYLPIFTMSDIAR